MKKQLKHSHEKALKRRVALICLTSTGIAKVSVSVNL